MAVQERLGLTGMVRRPRPVILGDWCMGVRMGDPAPRVLGQRVTNSWDTQG